MSRIALSAQGGHWARATYLIAAAVLLAVSNLACAPRVSLRVPAAAVAELPLERRLTLLDAENDLLAADDLVDAKNAAVDEVPAIRQDARDRLKAARERRQADAAADSTLRESEARATFVERDAEVRRAELHVAEVALLVAQARFEEARASEVEAAGLPHGSGVHKVKFHAQVERLAAVQAGEEAEANKKRAAAADADKKWRDARAELTRLTGGAQGSAWVQ